MTQKIIVSYRAARDGMEQSARDWKSYSAHSLSPRGFLNALRGARAAHEQAVQSFGNAARVQVEVRLGGIVLSAGDARETLREIESARGDAIEARRDFESGVGAASPVRLSLTALAGEELASLLA
ncbi:hypothetical protein [Acidomonas methanolica]|uniref:Uncharacterized protein n=1 Tax=Acidomonas methanolica NBRC 104435 TaxID=1231351 RepID=A0A023D7Q4_ACIMT|nr:hypothetical protein [Acidomonas methanolica]TCS24093.1 hypothetical protein EDC31_12514 [Acidomonas methanolica]GAJ29755.1 hypothetical protein Amme_076_048 [Acidomonas methanolica NBRC 104435]GBQ59359.1 hypothetical protein AA0498_2734 [Acidomonas methanolica]GEL00008.1 hypothetical protein AME01nite_25060 [Acidomonas methanolica NBRC 104435]